MGKEANPKLIGAFIVGAIALVVIGILALGQGQYFTRKFPVVMFFSGSVGGLQVGAPLNFQGVRIGTVTDVRARYDRNRFELTIPVRAEIEPDGIEVVGGPRPTDNRGEVLQRLIEKRNLRAQLTLQSVVTGQLAVELDFHPGTEASFVSEDKDVIEIPTVPSDIQQLQASLTKILNKLSALPLQEITRNIDSAIRSVNSVMKPIQSIATKADKRVDPIFDELESTLEAARATIQTANVAIASIEKNLNQTLRDADRLIVNVDKQVDPLARSAQATSDEIRQTFERARATLSNADVALRQATKTLKAGENLMGPDSNVRVELAETLRRISDMADSFNSLANFLERNPSALITGRQGR